MAIAFPISLPRPMRSGYSFQVAQLHVESPNDRGLSRRRRMGTGSTTKSILTWTFTASEWNTFSQWWRDDAAYGTLDISIRLLNGYDDALQDARILGPYSVVRLNGAYQVSVTVEWVAPPIASQSVMQDAIDNYDNLRFAGAFHYLVHVTLPGNL